MARALAFRIPEGISDEAGCGCVLVQTMLAGRFHLPWLQRTPRGGAAWARRTLRAGALLGIVNETILASVLITLRRAPRRSKTATGRRQDGAPPA